MNKFFDSNTLKYYPNRLLETINFLADNIWRSNKIISIWDKKLETYNYLLIVLANEKNTPNINSYQLLDNSTVIWLWQLFIEEKCHLLRHSFCIINDSCTDHRVLYLLPLGLSEVYETG